MRQFRVPRKTEMETRSYQIAAKEVRQLRRTLQQQREKMLPLRLPENPAGKKSFENRRRFQFQLTPFPGSLVAEVATSTPSENCPVLTSRSKNKAKRSDQARPNEASPSRDRLRPPDRRMRGYRLLYLVQTRISLTLLVSNSSRFCRASRQSRVIYNSNKLWSSTTATT